MESLLLVLISVATQVTFLHVNAQSTFCYNNPECSPGSSIWGGTCMTGRMQSPIQLSSLWYTPLVAGAGNTIQFSPSYQQNIAAPVIINNGHTVQVSANAALTSDMYFTSSVTGSTRYCFGQVHCHWGAEHTFDKIYRPNIECHIVHYDCSLGSIRAAAASGRVGSLAIFAIFYTISSTQKPLDILSPDPTFDLFANNIPKVRNPDVGSQPMDGPVNIYNMIPRVTSPAGLLGILPRYTLQAYHYMGSLTTPGCTEGMHWFVMRQIRQISVQQYQQFKTVLDEEGAVLRNNFRPTQPLNGRKVEQLVIKEVAPTSTTPVLSPFWFNNKIPLPTFNFGR